MAERYDWAAGPAMIEDHSVAKHELIQAYLERYVETLTTDPRMDRLRLTLIDGFAGGGLYEDARGQQQLGSPLRMLQAMRIARAKRKALVNKAFRLEVHYHFVDKDPVAISALRRALADGAVEWDQEEDKIAFYPRPFEEVFGDIVATIKAQDRSQRAIFLLDQYGYTDVYPEHIRRIMQTLNNPEIVFTFFADHLLDYLGSEGWTAAAKAATHVELSVDALRAANAGPQARKLVQMALSEQLRHRCGAPFFTPFFVRSRAAHRDYWLVHLAKHHRAHDVMLEQHWSVQNAYIFQHQGGGGLRMLGFDPKYNPHEPTMFDFNADAGKLTHTKLQEQLPQLLSTTGPITFEDLYVRIANETPADSQRVATALAELSREHIVQVEGHRPGTPPSGRDILTLSPQTRLFDLGGRRTGG